MKMSSFSILLRALAVVLSLMLLFGSLPVSALDGDDPEPTAAQETQAPTQVGEEATEVQQTQDEPTQTPPESPTEKKPDSTEPAVSLKKAPDDSDTIGISVFSESGNPVSYATPSLGKIEITINKGDTETEDIDALSVVFCERELFSASLLDTDNLIQGFANEPDWVTLSEDSEKRTVILNLRNSTAPDLTDGEYSIVVRDGHRNVEMMDVLRLTQAPGIKSFTGIPTDWAKDTVSIGIRIDGNTEYVDHVTYKENNGEAATATFSDGLYHATIDKYAAANSYSFTVVDLAGNKSTKTLKTAVKIDKDEPKLSIVKYTDGTNDIVPGTTWLTGTQKAYALLEAEDKNSDRRQSGIDEDSFTLNGEGINAVKDGDNYRIELSDPKTAAEITVKDKAGNEAKAKTEVFSIDATAPAQSDIQVVFSPVETLATKFLNALSFGLYYNDSIKMTVKVNSGGESDIADITVKDNGNVLTREDITDDGHGVFSAEYTLSAKNTEYDLTIQASDDAGNESNIFALNEIKKIYIKEKALEEGKTLYEVVATNLAPNMENEDFNISGTAINNYYVTTDGKQKVSMKIVDSLSGLDGDVELYFAKTDAFEKTDDQYTKLPKKAEDVEREPVNGTGEFSKKRVAENLEFKLPADLTSGDYTVLAIAKNNSGNTAVFPREIKIDNDGPVLSDATLKPSAWTNQEITVTFRAVDTHVGIDAKDVKVKKPDGGTLTPTDNKDGTYSFKTTVNGDYIATAVDKLGNPSNELKITVSNYDVDGPVINITGYEPDGDDNFWTSKEVKVSFEVTDNSDASVNLTIDDGTDHGPAVIHEGNRKYSFKANKNRVYTITATDQALNSAIAKTKEIHFDNQPPQIEKVVFSKETGNFKKFGIYDNEIITATVFVSSPGNAPVKEILLKNGSDPIEPNGTITQDSKDKNLYSLSFPLAISEKAYHLSVEATNKADVKATAKKLAELPLYVEGDEVAKMIEGKYKDAFELVLTDHKPAIDFDDDIKGYTSQPDETDATRKVFAGGGSGTISATVTDTLSGVEEIVSVKFDGQKVDADYQIDADKKEESVSVSYTFENKLTSGEHTFEIKAKNNAGNTRTLPYTFYLDQTAPTGTYNAPEEWTNQPIKVTLNINDDADALGYYSGINEVKVDGAVKVEEQSEGVYTFIAESRKDYQISMTDKLGNSAAFTVEAEDILFDNNAPELVDSKYNYDNDENKNWVSKEKGVTVSFNLTDDLSGVDPESIVITGDSNGETYSGRENYSCVKNTETGEVTCSFRADYYQTYTVTVTDSVKEEDENKATFTTPEQDKPKVDGTAPKIDSVTFESAATVPEKILNVLSFGLYSNNDIKMTVKATDAVPSSGMKSITAEHNDSVKIEAKDMPSNEPSGDIDVTVSREFIINTNSKAYDPHSIKLKATDNVGYDSDVISAADTEKYIVYPDAESAVIAQVEEGFEIVASDEKPKIDVIDLEGNGKQTVNDHVWFIGEPNDTEVTVTATITAKLTKLHDINVYLNDTKITEQVTGAGQITDLTAHSGDPISSKTISFSTGNLDCVHRASSGNAENVVRIVAVGNNSESTEDSRTFYIDDTKPKITSVRFESAKNAADSVLNVLTFGLYSNDQIKMTVNVADGADSIPSSGVKTITLNNTGSGKIDTKNFTPTNDSVTGSTSAGREYTYTISNAKYDPSLITLGVTDNVGNKPEDFSVATLNHEERIFTKNSETAKIFDEEKFEIVSTSQKPTVSDIKLSATPEAYSDGSKVWYQGNTTDEVGMKFTAEDKLSKLHSVKTEINGHNIIKQIYTGFENEPANTPDGMDAWVGENEETYTSNTAQSDVTGYLHRISESASYNQFTVDVCNNSGITVNKKSGQFYIDDAAPYITKFSFAGDGYSDVYADDENGGLNPAGVELREYGFYFKSTTDVTVTASDFVVKSNAQGSGVAYIGFRFVDINGETYDYGERAVDKNNQATFTVNADFKGQIFAYAVDNVTNKGSEITPTGLIVESGGAHNSHSDASIEFGQANYHGKDNNGLDLFSGDVTVSFTISDSISGLRDAYYTVTNGSQVVDFQQVNVSNGGSLNNNSWRIAQRESGTNLITRMTLTDTISASSFNANNLVVTLTAHDRAGYTIEEKKSLSIDITRPKIEVTYNPSDPVNTDSGNNYYSSTRTATITVTERNFDPSDFDWSKMIAIEGSVPSYAAGANWSTSYSDYTDDSQHTATVTFADDGKYEVILNFTDMAGNKADQVDAGQFYIDKTVPTISVSYSPDTEYYSGTVTATVTIVEHNFNPDGKYLTLTPHYYAPDQSTVKSGPTLAAWSSSGDTHTATLTFSEDGKYAFDIAFKDMALNNAQSYTGKTFYVDQTKPEITFAEAIKDGQAYDTQVQPGFDVFDFNYAGAESVKYTLTRYYYDFNTGKQTAEVIDNSSVKAEYIEGVIRQLFTYPLFAKTEGNDGVYILSVSATDRAGNVSDPASITFSVNCFGSVFLLASDETIQLAESGYTSDAPDILIKEINVNQLKEQTMTLSYNNSNLKLGNNDYSITSSGGGDQWYEYLYKISADMFEDEGSYTVTASSVDAKLGTVTTNRTVNTVDGDKAAHKNCPVSFIVDKTAPSVTINGVEENGAYSEAEREIQITCLDDNLDKDSVVLKINGEEVNLDASEIDDSLVGQLDINHTILANGQQTDYKVEVEAKDYAGVTGEGSVNKFTLSATWLTMFFHNTPAVIITSVVLATLIALAIFLILKKRRQENS